MDHLKRLTDHAIEVFLFGRIRNSGYNNVDDIYERMSSLSCHQHSPSPTSGMLRPLPTLSSNLILISVSRQSSMKSTLYHLSSFEFDNVIGDNFISDCLIGSCQSGVRKERPGDISRGQSVPISSSENSIVRIGK